MVSVEMVWVRVRIIGVKEYPEQRITVTVVRWSIIELDLSIEMEIKRRYPIEERRAMADNR
jgi:hypothetical protein